MKKRLAVVTTPARPAVRAVAFASFAAAAVWSPPARAAGIALDVQSGRGTGMAGAVAAMIDDSSAIFYNPAGIAQGRTLDVQVGDTLIMPSFQFTSPNGVSTGNAFEAVPPFTAYESGGITDDFSIGIGVFTPYGLTLAWPTDWAGRDQITKATFHTFDFNPTVAYRFGPLRIGAGLQLVRATVDLQKQIETGQGEASTELGAGTWGFGGNVGVQFEAVPRYLSLAVAYRSAVKFDFDGDSHFSNVPVTFQSVFRDQRVTTSLVTPDSVQIGVASHPIESLVLDADVMWYGWEKFRSIDIMFPNNPTLDTTEPKNWSNTVNVHVGGEGTIDPSWKVRAGMMYDPSPSPDDTLLPDVPDASRLNFAVGASYYHPCGFHVDLGYQLIFFFKRTSTAVQFPGDYSGIVNLVGLSVGYRTPTRER
jgi:long-chain fatty acid transport protein